MNNKLIQEKMKNEFQEIIMDLMANTMVQEMSKYRHHYTTSCLDHCLHVAYHNYIICKKLHLDYISATRAGLLHDLFLYDWRTKVNGRKGFHAFTHPASALENAKKITSLNSKEVDIILKHMWPVTFALPKYKESFIITLVDKYCALYESFDYYRDILFSKHSYRYAYLLLSLVVFKVI